jgi:IPT/TIG domain/Calcium-binding EGF domain
MKKFSFTVMLLLALSLAGCSCGGPDANVCSSCVEGASCDESGTPACACPAGYAGDGRTDGTGCTDVDECATGTATCLATATCADTEGSFACTCPAGFNGDGKTDGTGCTDVDECTTGTATCLATATCADTEGSFACTCPAGFNGDGTTTGTGCVDVDECTAGTDTCDPYATCVNTVGSFKCLGFYAVSPFTNMLYRLQQQPVAPSTIPSWTVLSTTAITGATVTGSNGLANDPITGDLYAIAKVTGVSGRVLGLLEPITGTFTTIGNLGDNFSSIAFRDDGQLFGVTGDGAKVPETLYLIDKSTGTTTLATALGNGADGEVVQFNPDDGFFYHWSGNGSLVFEKVEALPPYAVTNIPLTGTTSGEVFGAWWDAVNSNFVIFDISSRVHRVTAAGAYSGPEGNPLPSDLRTPGHAATTEHRVDPDTGVTAGGDTVTLNGAGFSHAGPTPTVTFGGAAATSVTVVDDTHITVVTPPGAVGTVDVSITAGSFLYNWPAGSTYRERRRGWARAQLSRCARSQPRPAHAMEGLQPDDR